MTSHAKIVLSLGLALAFVSRFTAEADSADGRRLAAIDLFNLEYATDPQISPDAERVVYVRNFMDIMKDRRRSNLWIVNADGSDHRALTSGSEKDSSPRWSPDGKRLLWVSSADGTPQLYVRWMDTGQTARLTNLTSAPSGLVWSPDGRWIALSMRVPAQPKPFVDPPDKPEGAEWAKPPKVIEKLLYRADGEGYLEDGFTHLFVLPADGGTPRQITSGDFDHTSAPVWTQDGRALVFAANRHADADYEPRNTEIYAVSLEGASIVALTDRYGPDESPTISADGRHIAYVGFDDRHQGYQVTRLYVMDRDGGGKRLLSGALDRDVETPSWSADGRGLFFGYSDRGNGKIGYLGLDGKLETLASDVGGTSIGRPYAGGSFSVARTGAFAYTMTRPDHPADVAVGGSGKRPVRRLTDLNEDLLGHKALASVEKIEFVSSFDRRTIEGWVVRPPDFDAERKYPMILEIHGGPFADYGDRFSAEIQLYAAAGYVVLYANPRGSTSYGEEFGNLIHHDYPGRDYDDLLSGVDALIARGSIDPESLFVTGGSGGGVLTAWIVGKSDRFRAAVVAKPVINWTSFVLTADLYNFFYRYWFTGLPWEEPDEYLRRSPLSLVGHVSTPTMLITGEADYRTPISESEQYYQALKLRRVDTALVRIPDASHGMDDRPSQLLAKVAHILKWFERYRASPAEDEDEDKATPPTSISERTGAPGASGRQERR